MNTAGRRVVWNTPSITADGLKIFACAAMLLQNIGIAIVQNGMIHLEQYTQESLSQAMEQDSHLMMLAGIGSILQLIGGLAIPIFAFLLVEGFRSTSNYRKYLFTLMLFAVISELPYDLAMSGKLFDMSGQNALFSMAVSLMMLYCLRMVQEKGGLLGGLLEIVIVLCGVLWVTMMRSEYGLCIVLLAAIFYLFYARNVMKTLLGVIISLMYVTGPLSFYGIWCYNGKRTDKLPKYAYYLFYPLHLLVLGIIAKMI